MVEVSTIIEKTLIRWDESNKKPRKVGEYHPSDCWSCFRKQFYIYKAVKTEKLYPLGIFEMGRRTEEAFYTILKEHYNEKRVGNDIPINIKLKNYKIVGETDPVVYKTDKKKKIQHLFEIKSQINLEPVKFPHEHHIKQLMCYLKGLKLDEGMLVYINRGDLLNIRDFTVKFDAEQWRQIISRLDMLHDFLKNNLLPAQKPLMNWECRYCNFNDRCINDFTDGVVDY